jgi:hypothetical protein
MSVTKKLKKTVKKVVTKVIKVADKQVHDITGKHVVKMPSGVSVLGTSSFERGTQKRYRNRHNSSSISLSSGLEDETLDKENATLG